MGKTYRNVPRTHLRHMKGRRKALANNLRSVPPDPWDDFMHDREALSPYRIAKRLVLNGWKDEDIERKIAHKFRIERRFARNIVAVERRVYGRKGEI